MDTNVLRRIGMTESDSKIYMTLLKLGKSNVTRLAEESGVHRTNIYSILDKLKEMSLVSEIKETGKKIFKINDPSNLLTYLRENEDLIKELIPNLKDIQESVKEKVEVEVFQGEKGMKSAIKDIIRVRKDVSAYGATGQLRKYLPIFALQWIRDCKHLKIKGRYVYVEGTELNEPYFQVKTLPKEFSTPVGTQIYGDRVLITIWEPTLVAILIKSKEVADNYRLHFDLLWKIAKK
ncbi:MAG: helix-turn-helix domain-containing protein [Nanoarchaeota archaeon]